jgi:hypothetical protein
MKAEGNFSIKKIVTKNLFEIAVFCNNEETLLNSHNKLSKKTFFYKNPKPQKCYQNLLKKAPRQKHLKKSKFMILPISTRHQTSAVTKEKEPLVELGE